ncbi:MAG: YbaB/EbfC family nucleoid-associated protein [Actinomycetota bacterium]|nr:YbaB/EbfC family nucleoid-associated protein [Actinomycetota bacterium]
MTDQFDMNNLLQQAQAMQQQLLDAQAKAAELVVEGQAGGGMVKVRLTGGMEVQSVSIGAEVVDPDDVPMLEDLVRAAFHDAMAKVQEATQEATRVALGGLDLGGLGLH